MPGRSRDFSMHSSRTAYLGWRLVPRRKRQRLQSWKNSKDQNETSLLATPGSATKPTMIWQAFKKELRTERQG